MQLFLFEEYFLSSVADLLTLSVVKDPDSGRSSN
jgi:hypothetical protein